MTLQYHIIGKYLLSLWDGFYFQFCASSCPAQAWSVACVLEVLYDLEEVGLVDDIAPRRNSADLSQQTVLV